MGNLVREGLDMMLSTGAPIMSVLLVVGFAVGIFQAVTQINDPAVGFVPRLIAGGGVVLLLGPWMLERMAAFLLGCIQMLPNAAR
ncbi:MAG: flagellar biosynthetic protein FliQ [Myxococcota bacterium]